MDTIDVELLDDDDAAIAIITAQLGRVSVTATGLIVATEPIDYRTMCEIKIAAWRVWIGGEQVYGKLPNPTTLFPGDTYRISRIAFPTKFIGSIDFGPNGGGGKSPDKPKSAGGWLSRLLSVRHATT